MSKVWQSVPYDEVRDRGEPALRRLAEALVGAEGPETLRSASGGLAVLVPWVAVEASSELATDVEADAGFHRVALLLAPESAEAGGLLRHADVVAIPGAGGTAAETPSGLAPCGRIALLDPTAPVASLDLYRAAPVDRGRMMRGAPVDLDVEEDLDAREDWFKKRHGDGD